jgi:hypothetical protein
MKMRLFSKSLTAALVGAAAFVAVSAASQAGTISIYSTGVDDSGNVLATGPDTHYSGGPTTLYAHSSYFANDPVGSHGSQWLGSETAFPDASGLGTFDYTVHFSLAEGGTHILSGLWGTDNQGLDILINGVSTGISLLGVNAGNFTALHAFTTTAALSSLFQLGDNTLTFRIENDGGPGGFRTANLTVATTPIPPAILLFMTALGGIGIFGYRRRGAASVA